MTIYTTYTFDEINDRTGFANGALFQTEAEVRAYFTTANMDSMFGSEESDLDDDALSAMADDVIACRWHMAT